MNASSILDPVTLELVDQGGERKLLLLDSLRHSVGVYSLDGDLERCVRIPVDDGYLTGVVAAPSGTESFPTLFVGSRSTSGGGGGGAAQAEEGGGAGAVTAGGVHRVLDIDSIFFDREASDVVLPVRIGERRTLVLKARFSDGVGFRYHESCELRESTSPGR